MTDQEVILWLARKMAKLEEELQNQRFASDHWYKKARMLEESKEEPKGDD